jgi:hypothetical protein
MFFIRSFADKVTRVIGAYTKDATQPVWGVTTANGTAGKNVHLPAVPVLSFGYDLVRINTTHRFYDLHDFFESLSTRDKASNRNFPVFDAD